MFFSLQATVSWTTLFSVGITLTEVFAYIEIVPGVKISGQNSRHQKPSTSDIGLSESLKIISLAKKISALDLSFHHFNKKTLK